MFRLLYAVLDVHVFGNAGLTGGAIASVLITLLLLASLAFVLHAGHVEFAITGPELLATVIAAATLVLTAVAILIALLTFVGFREIGRRAERAAREQAEGIAAQIAREVAEPVAARTAEEYVAGVTGIGAEEEHSVRFDDSENRE